MDKGEWLMEPHRQDLELRVKRGAAWLGERDPDWAYKILDAQEQGVFDMCSYGNCAVGVVLGDYYEVFGGTTEEDNRNVEAAELGFMGVSVLGGREISEEFAALEEMWLEMAEREVGDR